MFIKRHCSFRIIVLFTDIDDCFNHTCDNGAACVDGVNNFSCSCLPGYTGKLCKTGKISCFGAVALVWCHLPSLLVTTAVLRVVHINCIACSCCLHAITFPYFWLVWSNLEICALRKSLKINLNGPKQYMTWRNSFRAIRICFKYGYNGLSLVERACLIKVENTELKVSSHPPIYTMSDHFPDSSLAWFHQLTPKSCMTC